MKPSLTRLPRFLIGLTLVLWGFATEQIVFGIALAVLVEFGTFSPVKWDLSREHYYRAADLTSVFFALVTVYQFNEHSIYGIYKILALLPVCVMPLLLIERYSVAGAIPLSALFLSLRRRVSQGLEQERYISLGLPYLIVTVLAASAGKIPSLVYFAGATSILLAALFRQRSKRYRVSAWAGTFVTVIALSFAIQFGIQLARQSVEASFSYWLHQFAWFQTNPDRERTAIGSIGRLKLSDRIRVRMDAPLSTPIPIYLHEASYVKFNLGAWSSVSSTFTAIDPLPSTTRWLMGDIDSDNNTREAKIIIDHKQDVGVAPLPFGISEISGSEIIEVQRNQYDAVLLEALPGQLEYNIFWHEKNLNRAEPGPDSLSIPDNYLPVIGEIAAEIGLKKDHAVGAIKLTKNFFASNFKYSLIQKGFYPGRTPLAHFLKTDRKGHCEYFATATALLLRYAGIPTRYSVGYVLHEYSSLEKSFVGRARHAHSWTEAYVGGQWVSVDTTPSEWAAMEQEQVSAWQDVLDLWSWISNRYQRFQRADETAFTDNLIWLVPPLTIILLWRLRSRARNVEKPDTQDRTGASNHSDTEGLYALMKLFKDRGFALNNGSTLRQFLLRHAQDAIDGVQLKRLLALHYKQRFSQSRLSDEERAELVTGCDIFLRHYRVGNTSK